MIKAVLGRPDVPIEVRRQALETAAPTDAERAAVLMQLVHISFFVPEDTAQAITPLLLEMPGGAVLSISHELDALLDNTSPALRSTAAALMVKSGAPLNKLAERDPAALIEAIASLTPEQAAPTLSTQLLDLADAGLIDAGAAFTQATRLSTNKATLFTRLADAIDKVKGVGFDQWGPKHLNAMAARAAMHSIPDEQWPDGFDGYRIQRGDQIVVDEDDRGNPITMMDVGHDLYHHEEQGCVKCHGPDGHGTEGFPPLAGSPTLLGNPSRPATIVKFGLAGVLHHTTNPADGKPYNAQMEPLSYITSDGMVAAVLTYARQNFGNFAEPVTIEQVELARAPRAEEKHGTMWAADALFKRFPFERDVLVADPDAPPADPLPLDPVAKLVHWKAPPAGLWYMLLSVSAVMGAILGVTCLGPGPINGTDTEHAHANLA